MFCGCLPLLSFVIFVFFCGQPFPHDPSMNVSLFDLKAQNAALEPRLQEAFLRVLRSGHFILGPEV